MKKQPSKSPGALPSTAGFVGFSAFAAGVPAASTGGGDGDGGGGEAGAPSPSSKPAASNEPFYQGADSELGAILRRLAKRDVTTKLKALQELGAAVPSRDRVVLRELLPAWSYAYLGLALHNDRRVRAGAHAVLGDLVAAGLRKSFAPHLPKMLPYWWLAVCDPAREVAAAADAALGRMFPGSGRRLEALGTYAPELVGGLCLMLAHGPGELSDMRVSSPEEAAERQERVHATALDALAALVRALAAGAEEAGSAATDGSGGDGAATPTAASGASPPDGAAASPAAVAAACTKLWRALGDALGDKAVWRKCADRTPHIRRAGYRLIAACATHAPHLLADPVYVPAAAGVPATTTTTPASSMPQPQPLLAVLVPRSHIASTALGSALGDATGSNQHAAWEAALSLVKHLPATWGAQLSGLAATAAAGGEHGGHMQAVLNAAAQHATAPSAVLLPPPPPAAAYAPADVPGPIDLPKVLWPRLFGSLKHAGYGAPDVVLASVLPLLATMPPALLLQRDGGADDGSSGGKKKGKAQSGTVGSAADGTFALQLLHAAWAGLRATGDEALPAAGQRALVHSFAECAVYTVSAVTRPDAGSGGVDVAAATAVAHAATSLLGALAMLAFDADLGGGGDDGDADVAAAAESLAKDVAASPLGGTGGAASPLRAAALQNVAHALRRLSDVATRRARTAAGASTDEAPPQAQQQLGLLLSGCVDRLWAAVTSCTLAVVQAEAEALRWADGQSTGGDVDPAWPQVASAVTAVLDAFGDAHAHRQDWGAVVRADDAAHHQQQLRLYLTAVTSLALGWLGGAVNSLATAPTAVHAPPLRAAEAVRPADVVLSVLTRTDLPLESVAHGYLASRGLPANDDGLRECLGGLAHVLVQSLAASAPAAAGADTPSSPSPAVSVRSTAEALLFDLAHLLLAARVKLQLRQAAGTAAVPPDPLLALGDVARACLGGSVYNDTRGCFSPQAQLPAVLAELTANGRTARQRADLLAAGAVGEAVHTATALVAPVYVLLQAYQTVLDDVPALSRAAGGAQPSEEPAVSAPAAATAAAAGEVRQLLAAVTGALLLKQLAGGSDTRASLADAVIALTLRLRLVDASVGAAVAAAAAPLLQRVYGSVARVAVGAAADVTAGDDIALATAVLSALHLLSTNGALAADAAAPSGAAAPTSAVTDVAALAWLLRMTVPAAAADGEPALVELRARAAALTGHLQPFAGTRLPAAALLPPVAACLRSSLELLRAAVSGHVAGADVVAAAAGAARLVHAVLSTPAAEAAARLLTQADGGDSGDLCITLVWQHADSARLLLWSQLVPLLQPQPALLALLLPDPVARGSLLLQLSSGWVAMLDAAARDCRAAAGRAASRVVARVCGGAHDAAALGLLGSAKKAPSSSSPSAAATVVAAAAHPAPVMDALGAAVASASAAFVSDVGSDVMAPLLDSASAALSRGVAPRHVAAAVRAVVVAAAAARRASAAPVRPTLRGALASMQASLQQSVALRAEADSAVASLRPDEEATAEEFDEALALSVAQPAAQEHASGAAAIAPAPSPAVATAVARLVAAAAASGLDDDGSSALLLLALAPLADSAPSLFCDAIAPALRTALGGVNAALAAVDAADPPPPPPVRAHHRTPSAESGMLLAQQRRRMDEELARSRQPQESPSPVAAAGTASAAPAADGGVPQQQPTRLSLLDEQKALMAAELQLAAEHPYGTPTAVRTAAAAAVAATGSQQRGGNGVAHAAADVTAASDSSDPPGMPAASPASAVYATSSAEALRVPLRALHAVLAVATRLPPAASVDLPQLPALQAALARAIHACVASLTTAPATAAALAAALSCSRLLIPTLLSQPSAAIIDAAFRRGCWCAVTSALAAFLAVPTDESGVVGMQAPVDLLAAAALLPSLAVLDVAYGRHAAEVASGDAAARAAAAQQAAAAATEARRREDAALAAAEAAVDEDSDGIDVDAPEFAARRILTAMSGLPSLAAGAGGALGAAGGTPPAFPPPLPPSLAALLAVHAAAKVTTVVQQTAAAAAAGGTDADAIADVGSTWDAAAVSLSADLCHASLALWSQRHVHQMRPEEEGGGDATAAAKAAVGLTSRVASLLAAVAPSLLPGLVPRYLQERAAVDVRALCPAPCARAAAARLVERLAVAGLSAPSALPAPGVAEAAFDDFGVALARALLWTPPTSQAPEAPAAPPAGEEPPVEAPPGSAVPAAEQAAPAASAAPVSRAASLLSAGRHLLSSLLGSGSSAPHCAATEEQHHAPDAAAPASQPQQEQPRQPPSEVLYLAPTAGGDDGSLGGALSTLLEALLPPPVPVAATAEPSPGAATPAAASAADVAADAAAHPSEPAGAALTRGRALLPPVVAAALADPALHLRAELCIDDICNSGGGSGGASPVTDAGLAGAEGAMRTALLALRYVQAAAPTPAQADDGAAFLCAPLAGGDTGGASTGTAVGGGGGGLFRLLTAGMHLLLHRDDEEATAAAEARRRGEPPPPPRPLTAHPHPGVASLLRLSLGLTLRLAASLPLRFADFWAGLPRGMAQDVERLVSRHVTPVLVRAQLAALRAATAPAGARGSSAGSGDATGWWVPQPARLVVAELPPEEEAGDDGLAPGEDVDLQCLEGPAEEPASSTASTTAGASGGARRWDPATFKVRGSEASRDVVATYHQDEATLQIRVSLPPSFPLKRVGVACEQRMGVTEDRWRRWELQIKTLLATQEGSLVDALDFWRCCLDKEFEGVEPCPICYATIHMSNRTLPRLPCPTCKNKYHSACLYKWFETSPESKCPMCRQSFR